MYEYHMRSLHTVIWLCTYDTYFLSGRMHALLNHNPVNDIITVVECVIKDV